MFLLSFFRVIKFSFQDIIRNIWLSAVTIMILVLALFSINLLLVVKVISSSTVNAVKEKIDITLYLKSDAEENRILALKSQVENLGSVKQVDYVNKQVALEDFREKHKNKPEILQALLELGKNPLSPSLIIKPKDINNYEELVANLNKINDDIIESKDFDDYKVQLAKINSIAQKANQVGLFVSLLFVLITMLVVYNAVRVAISTHKREIGIMRLVGASAWFIRAPYLISSMIYSFFGVIIVIIIIYPLLNLFQPYLTTFFSGFEVSLLNYYNSNFILIFGLEFLAASLINALASLVAISKYSKV
ncbi:MAG: ABC transporter permease [Patescibacteria group bacterium]